MPLHKLIAQIKEKTFEKKSANYLQNLKKALLSRITDQRDRRILFAAFTAFAAKFGGVALQFIFYTAGS